MAELFPTELQDQVNEAGFSNQFGETVIRSDMDVGPAKVRKRFTNGIDTFSVTMKVIKSQYEILENFYKTTLAGGSLTFLYDHPITNVETEFRFLKAPTFSPMGGLYFQASMSWEEMP